MCIRDSVIDRQGKVDMVIVGDPASILIPELPRGRGAAGRLRGIRLMHTHLSPDGLSQEDLMDMLFPVSYTHLDVYKRQLQGRK